jgi:hypothetical protein
MEQAEVLKKLDSLYHVGNMEGDRNTFAISEGIPGNYSSIGGVSFDNGRLAWIQRRWGRFEGKVDSIDVTQALFSAIESAKGISGASASVSTEVTRVPGAETQCIYFAFPGRKITVLSTVTSDGTYAKDVSISESVSIDD